MTNSDRPDFFSFHNGNKTPLPFKQEEYNNRIFNLRTIMESKGVHAAVLTSMHNVAYYTGFLYCSFGRPYGCIITPTEVVTISAGIDAGQPWRRSAFDSVTYTDWERDNFWRAALSITGSKRNIGYEGDHITIHQFDKLKAFLNPSEIMDIGIDTMNQRMLKSDAEIDLIREGARIADIGGYAIKDAIKVGKREIDIAMIGRDAMEAEIAKSFPDSELRDNWVWFQSGINTDGAHNPVTARILQHGDILSLNAFPMISGYYTALERTLFVGEVDEKSLAYWSSNIEAHELGISLIQPGKSCSEITKELNRFFIDKNLLQYRSFGYGHSFGVLSHYYGREAGLELREDIDTELKPGMVVSMEPMITIPSDQEGAGGYREHDILVIKENGAENITKYPYGPDFNIIK